MLKLLTRWLLAQDRVLGHPVNIKLGDVTDQGGEGPSRLGLADARFWVVKKVLRRLHESFLRINKGGKPVGMDLYAKQGDMYLNNFGWSRILMLAHQFGWQPMGTEAPDWEVLGADPPIHVNYPDWDGTYCGNEGQWVNDRDARNIASALERALEHIPDHDAIEDEIGLIQDEPVNDHDTACNMSAIECFSGQGKKKVQEFIAFCKMGGFSIW